MNFSKKSFPIAATFVGLALFACSQHNPESVLNPESGEFDPALAADTNSNGIADGLEPYWEECGGDAKCAGQKALDAKNATQSSSDALSSGMEGSSTILSSSQNQASSAKPISSSGTQSSEGGNSSGGTSSQATSSGTSSQTTASSSAAASSGSFKVTVVGGTIVDGGSTGYFDKNDIVSLALNPFVGGLDVCRSGWVTADVQGDFITDTISFAMPEKNVTFTGGTRECLDTITDGRNGKEYPYSTLGGNRWLMTNIDYSLGTDDFCYDNDVGNCETYGRLYRFSAAATACPEGWRQPTAAEILVVADDLNLLSTGRGDQNDPPGFSYIAPSTRISYWVTATGNDQNIAKNCDAKNGEDCGFILTNEAGIWQIASDSKVKSYPIRCIQE